MSVDMGWREPCRMASQPNVISHFAPLSVQEVVQVTVTPFRHFLQASTHCSIDFGL